MHNHHWIIPNHPRAKTTSNYNQIASNHTESFRITEEATRGRIQKPRYSGHSFRPIFLTTTCRASPLDLKNVLAEERSASPPPTFPYPFSIPCTPPYPLSTFPLLTNSTLLPPPLYLCPSLPHTPVHPSPTSLSYVSLNTTPHPPPIFLLLYIPHTFIFFSPPPSTLYLSPLPPLFPCPSHSPHFSPFSPLFNIPLPPFSSLFLIPLPLTP